MSVSETKRMTLWVQKFREDITSVLDITNYVNVRGQNEDILCVSEDPVIIFMWLSEDTVRYYVSDREQRGSSLGLRSKCVYYVIVRDQDWGFIWVSEGTVRVLSECQMSQYSYYVSAVALMILCVRDHLRI